MKPPRWLMRELRAVTTDAEPPAMLPWAAPLPGEAGFIHQLWPVWLSLAAIGLYCGLAWRAQGGGPDLYKVLDALNAALWLVALALWPAWQEWQQRLQAGAGHLALSWQVRSLAALKTLFMALVLCLALSGLLLGYAPQAGVARIVLSDASAVFALPLWAAMALALLILAPAVLLLALVALHLCQALGGSRAGLVLWLLLALAGNSRLVCGIELGSQVPQVSSALRRVISLLQASAEQTYYLEDAWNDGLLWPLGWLLLAAILLALVQLGQLRPAARYSAVWLAALAGSMAMSAVMLAQLWQASAINADQAGGSVQQLLLAGLACSWLVLVAVELGAGLHAGSAAPLADLAFVLLAVSSGVLLTLPSLLADQASKREVLALAAVCGSLWLLVAAVVRCCTRWAGRRRGVVQLCLLLLALPWIPLAAVPLPVTALSLELSQALLDPLAASNAGWVVTSIAVLGLLGLLWPLIVRPALKRRNLVFDAPHRQQR